jgi:hypothetical protein
MAAHPWHKTWQAGERGRRREKEKRKEKKIGPDVVESAVIQT